MKKTQEELMQEVLHAVDSKFAAEEGVLKTPKRFIYYLNEFFKGPVREREVLGTLFPCKNNHDMVIQDQIPFRMACEHHLLPAWGHAAIGYVPGDHVVGISKLARIVDAIGTERPSMQEHITHRIADVFNDYVKPKGVMVVTKAQHGCMAARGVRAPGTYTTASAVRGVFMVVEAARAEFLSLAKWP